MKKAIPLILALVIILSVLIFKATNSSVATSEDFEYNVISEANKTCEITKYNGTETNLTIPSKLDGYNVIWIGYEAFSICSSIESVTIPNSVTIIGKNSFAGCTSLKNVTIPDSVISIGQSAFYGTAYYNNPDNWKNGALYIGNHLIDTDA